MSTKSNKFERSKLGVISRIWFGQAKSKNHLVTYNKEWFVEWCLASEEFDIIYSKWVESGYLSSEKPSIDRIDSSGIYEESNIQVMTWGENHKKGMKERGKPVVQYTLEGVKIATFNSIGEASEKTGVSSNHISRTVKGKGGCRNLEFDWKFLREEN